MKKVADWLSKFMSGDRRSKDMMQLAKTEYGKDWEYAYHCLMTNKRIDSRNVKGITT